MARQTVSRAVLFADVSDSSALYQKLGDLAASGVVKACLEIMSDVVSRFEGTLVKTLGDAALCTFPSADLAVRAASAMQAAMAQARPEGHAMAIHIGIHYGPVLLEEADVFGDTVNVAAYLTSVAAREQILTTELTATALSPELKAGVRPVFQTVLKGSGRESVVCQVLWKTDRVEVTEINLDSNRVIPGDIGSLLVGYGERTFRVDQWRPKITIGRATTCDIVLSDQFASRQHLTIRALRTRFYLVDHSINGTFVTAEGETEIHVLRAEVPLEGSGTLALGRSRKTEGAEIVTFRYDRRSMFRI